MKQRLDIDPNAYPTGERREHLLMRQAARGYLGQLGIGTNPGFTDKNIVDSLRQQAGLEPVNEWDESLDIKEAVATLKVQLTAVLEASGVSPLEPVEAVSIDMAFDRLARQS